MIESFSRFMIEKVLLAFMRLSSIHSPFNMTILKAKLKPVISKASECAKNKSPHQMGILHCIH